MHALQVMLTYKQLRPSFHRTQLQVPLHPHRPPTQFLCLQYCPPPQQCQRERRRLPYRVCRVSSTIILICGCHSILPRPDGPCKYNASANVCVRDLQQGLHKSSMWPLTQFCPPLTSGSTSFGTWCSCHSICRLHLCSAKDGSESPLWSCG